VHGRKLHVLRDDALARGIRRRPLPRVAQPVTPLVIVGRRLAVMGLGDRLDDFNTLVRLRTSVGLEQRIPVE
jgi:hypothetical protein